MTDKKTKPNDQDHEGNVGLVTETKVRTRRPPLYKVVLINDDYTPMEFVIEVLEKFFHKDHAAATQIMLSVHNEGRGVCGLFPRDVAETKVTLVNDYSRRNQHPLQCALEKA